VRHSHLQSLRVFHPADRLPKALRKALRLLLVPLPPRALQLLNLLQLHLLILRQ
jgi:hypothetical protein